MMPTASSRRHAKRRPALGRVDDTSAGLAIEAFELEVRRMEDRAEEHWRDLARALTQDVSHTYDLMNGLGYSYGALLAGSVLEGLRSALERGGSDGLAEAARDAVAWLGSIAADVEARRQTRSTAVVSRAFRDLEEKVPDWVDPAKEIRKALEGPAWGGRSVYYNDFHWDVEEALLSLARRLETFLAWHGVGSAVAYRVPIELPLRYEAVPADLVELSEDEERKLFKTALRAANRLAAQRTYYGLRREPIPSEDFFTALFWANGPALWFIDHWLTELLVVMRARGERDAILDGNYILVPFPALIMEKVAPFMEPHPLYSLSFEAKERGEYAEATDAEIRRAIRSAIDAETPKEDPEERALAAAEWLDVFREAKKGDPAAKLQAQAFLAAYRVHPAFARLVERWLEGRR